MPAGRRLPRQPATTERRAIIVISHMNASGPSPTVSCGWKRGHFRRLDQMPVDPSLACRSTPALAENLVHAGHSQFGRRRDLATDVPAPASDITDDRYAMMQ